MGDLTARTELASARLAYEHVERLCELGDRFAGRSGDTLAAAYVKQVFAGLDLEIEQVDVAVHTWHEERCRLLLGDGTELEAVAPFFGGATAGPLTAPVLWLESQKQLADATVDGKVVCLPAETGYGLFWLGGLAAGLRDRGAAALLLVHAMPWPYRPTMESGQGRIDARFSEPRLPAVVISSTGGRELARALGAGMTTVTLDIATELEPCVSPCLAGVRRGSSNESKRVVVLAHRDHACPPGANDNGSGTAAMLEVARLLAGEQHERSLVFLSTAAEESAAAGAQRYIESLGARADDIACVVSLDMIAAGGPLNVVETAWWPDLGALPHTDWLNDCLVETADELGYRLGRMQGDWGAAESGRFLAAGIPAAWLWKPDDPRYHSDRDTPAGVDPNALKVAADIVAAAVRKLANGPLPPR